MKERELDEDQLVSSKLSCAFLLDCIFFTGSAWLQKVVVESKFSD